MHIIIQCREKPVTSHVHIHLRFIVIVDLSICAGQVIEPGSHKIVVHVQASLILESHIGCFNYIHLKYCILQHSLRKGRNLNIKIKHINALFKTLSMAR